VLINDCNHRNNREPVANFDEETVRLALQQPERKRQLALVVGTDSRANT
jgi:uncharacterized protein YceH (UPF0502 family)